MRREECTYCSFRNVTGKRTPNEAAVWWSRAPLAVSNSDAAPPVHREVTEPTLAVGIKEVACLAGASANPDSVDKQLPPTRHLHCRRHGRGRLTHRNQSNTQRQALTGDQKRVRRKQDHAAFGASAETAVNSKLAAANRRPKAATSCRGVLRDSRDHQ